MSMTYLMISPKNGPKSFILSITAKACQFCNFQILLGNFFYVFLDVGTATLRRTKCDFSQFFFILSLSITSLQQR